MPNLRRMQKQSSSNS